MYIAAAVIFAMGGLVTWLLMEVVSIPDNPLIFLVYLSCGFPVIPGLLALCASIIYVSDDISSRRG